MTNLDELDFNEMTFGRFNPSFQNVGPYTPPNINTNSPKQSKSKREIQLENRLKNNPELTKFTLTAEEKKKLIPIPKKTNKNKKGGKRKTRSNRGGDNSKRKLNGNDEEFLKKKREKLEKSINMARLFGYRNSPEKDPRNMIPSYLYKEPDPDGVKELRSRFDRDMDIEGEYHEMEGRNLTFGGKKTKKNKKTKRIRKKGGGRKDEYGKRTTKNTKKKDNQGRNLGSSKGTRVKLANIQKATHKKENNKNKIK